MKNLSMTEFTSARELFKNMPAFEAVDILCSIFNTPQSTIFVQTPEGMFESRQVVDLYEDYEIYCGVYARDYRLLYYGGPPGKATRCKGSLMTMVIDKFLRALVADHTTLVSNLLEYAHEQKWYNDTKSCKRLSIVGP